MSETTGTIERTSKRTTEGSKILRFPTLIAEGETAPTALPAMPSERRTALATAEAEAALMDVAAPTGSIWERLAVVRRGRGERAAGKATRTKRAESTQAVQPSVAQLVTWMLNLRRGGVGSIYWNAAKLPLDVALVRAARLDDAAVINVIGHRLLIVEPLRARAEAPVAAQ